MCIRIAPLSVQDFFSVLLPVLESKKKKSTDEMANCSLLFSNKAGGEEQREGEGEREMIGQRETFRALNFDSNGFRCARFNRLYEPAGSGRTSH